MKNIHIRLYLIYIVVSSSDVLVIISLEISQNIDPNRDMYKAYTQTETCVWNIQLRQAYWDVLFC